MTGIWHTSNCWPSTGELKLRTSGGSTVITPPGVGTTLKGVKATRDPLVGLAKSVTCADGVMTNGVVEPVTRSTSRASACVRLVWPNPSPKAIS